MRERRDNQRALESPSASLPDMALRFLAPIAAALIVASASAVAAFAQDQTPVSGAAAAAHADGQGKANEINLPPFPADRTVRQSAHLGNATLDYDATVGTLQVRNAQGHPIADVVFTAYILRGGGADRPVTFAFNGGPGAASVYLNLGAIGPKRLQFGAQGNNPSDPPVLADNPNSWLDMTDLVFIDPVGTGFSRSLEDEN